MTKPTPIATADVQLHLYVSFRTALVVLHEYTIVEWVVSQSLKIRENSFRSTNKPVTLASAVQFADRLGLDANEVAAVLTQLLANANRTKTRRRK